jgi:N-acetylmuramoyl-L-alanine amidase
VAHSRKIRVIVFPPSTWPLLVLLALFIFSAAALTLSPSAGLVSLYYGSPLKGVTVAIDPGHGGIDPGVHFESVMLEKEIVLEIGLELRRLLEQAGSRVMITREKDEDLSRHFPDDTLPRHRRDVRGRVKLINASAANLSISLHINSIHDTSVRGPIAFYAGGNPENKRLAEAVQKNINPLFSADAKPGQLVHQHPQESNVFYILNEADMPSVLLETAFMTSPDDRELLKSKSFRKKIARAIFVGVVDYIFGKDDEGLLPEQQD